MTDFNKDFDKDAYKDSLKQTSMIESTTRFATAGDEIKDLRKRQPSTRNHRKASSGRRRLPGRRTASCWITSASINVDHLWRFWPLIPMARRRGSPGRTGPPPVGGIVLLVGTLFLARFTRHHALSLERSCGPS